MFRVVANIITFEIPETTIKKKKNIATIAENVRSSAGIAILLYTFFFFYRIIFLVFGGVYVMF